MYSNNSAYYCGVLIKYPQWYAKIQIMTTSSSNGVSHSYAQDRRYGYVLCLADNDDNSRTVILLTKACISVYTLINGEAINKVELYPNAIGTQEFTDAYKLICSSRNLVKFFTRKS